MSSKNYDRKCKECDEQYTNDLNAEYEWCKICQVKYLENFTSGNEKIDVLIQEIQSKINDPNDILFGWIPYNQFDDVEEVGTNDFTTVYSAIWKDGPSHYSYFKKELTKVSNKKVILKCLHNNSQNIINVFLNEVRTYSINYLNNALKIYGISQTPDTKDYIMVLHDEYFEKCCKKCAIWKDGPLYYEYMTGWAREPNKKVILKRFENLHDSTNEFLNEVKPYSIDYYDNNFKIYGISQNPNTSDYIMVLQNEYCEKCVKCAIWKDGPLSYSYVKKELTRVSDKKVALKPYYNSKTITNEFVDEVKKYSINYLNNILKIYGISQNPYTNDYIMEWIRNPNKKVALKCLHNSQNITNEFLNEVKAYLKLNTRFIIDIYGISQDLNTGNYILIFYYAEGGSLYGWLNDNYKEFSWSLKLKALLDVIQGLKEIHQKQMVHRDLHTGNLLISTNNVRNFNVYISSMELCGEVSNIDKTKIYGLMPYVAPEVLRASGREPFANYAHDSVLALNICNGIRPEVNEKIAPKCYIDLMKVCWDPDPDKRPSAIEIEELICTFKLEESEEIKKQFKEAEEYRKANLEMNALPKYDDDNISISSSSSVGTAEIIDFTDL
ncbi:kinase-like domain-containing protein [Rhizophagus irregularis DAOM 181602=DAOM 197198]|nr:kinase-like domain-containing protein [Rhizophagus irregularis DAOM 181602=DAOM 197198]